MIDKNINLDDYICFIKKISLNKKIYIFGAGSYGDIIGRHLTNNDIEWYGYIDNSSLKQGQTLNCKAIYSLQTVLRNNYSSDLFVLVSVSPLPFKCEQESIENQLIAYGLAEENYYFISHNLELVDDIVYIIKNADSYIKKSYQIKDIYIGKRAFIIGNGPSLNIDDLNKLKNEISFGCNRITQMYNHTNWRLTDYFFADPLFISNSIKCKDDMNSISSEHKHAFTTLQSRIYDEYKDEYNNLYFLRINRSNKMRFSEDIAQTLGSGGTSLFEIFQIAVYMGVKEFYLLGVDYSFNKEMKNDGKLIVNENVQSHAKEIDQGNGIYYVDDIMKAWLTMKEYADSHSIKIYNATRGGKLEVFPRIEFDSLF